LNELHQNDTHVTIQGTEIKRSFERRPLTPVLLLVAHWTPHIVLVLSSCRW
jgi:hypothetical protein